MVIISNFVLRYKIVTSYCIVLSLLLCSCVKGEYRQNQKVLAGLYSNKQYKAIEKFVNKKKFLPENKNQLLKNLEVGKAYYDNHKYCNAIEKFNTASRIVQEQYTKSIGSSISSAIGVGDDIFYGETYEKSLLNFYKSLINYKIYQRGYCEPLDGAQGKKDNLKFDEKGKLNFLNASRSNILYWDSWINGRYIEDNDKFYINDILLKLWGAFIHEQFNDNANLQIARQLYKDAKEIAKNRYIVYQTFNKKNQSFSKYIKDLQKRSAFIEKDNIYVNDIVEYCDRQLERLKNKEKVNLAIIISDGSIGTKGVVEHKIPILSILSLASANIMDIIFALGLDKATYELPYVNYKQTDYRYFYELKKGNDIVIRKPVVLSEPITDISYMSLKEKLEGIKTKVIASMTAKYISVLTPIAVAYGIAKNSKNELVKLSGLAGAIAAYKASEYLITESSRVDIRQWVGLPSNIFIVSDKVENGQYKLNIIKQKNMFNGKGVIDAQEMIVYQKDVEISDNVLFIDVNL